MHTPILHSTTAHTIESLLTAAMVYLLISAFDTRAGQAWAAWADDEPVDLPSILRPGPELEAAAKGLDSDEVVQTEYISCRDGLIRLEEGSIHAPDSRRHVKPQKGVCENEGILVSEPLYRTFLPAMHACALALLGLPSETRTPVEVIHVGVYNPRNVEGKSSLSLHSFARAIDVLAVRVGSLYLDYQQSLLSADTSERDSFWYQLKSCLREEGMKTDTKITTLDARFNDDHRDHVHISVPFERRIAGVASGLR